MLSEEEIKKEIRRMKRLQKKAEKDSIFWHFCDGALIAYMKVLDG